MHHYYASVHVNNDLALADHTQTLSAEQHPLVFMAMQHLWLSECCNLCRGMVKK